MCMCIWHAHMRRAVEVIMPSMLEYWPLTMSRLNLRSVIIFVASSSEASGKMLRGLPMSWHTFQTWSGSGSGLGLGLLWETFGVRVVF